MIFQIFAGRICSQVGRLTGMLMLALLRRNAEINDKDTTSTAKMLHKK